DEHVRPAEPLEAHFNASSLPSALGGYVAKAKDPDKKYGSKVPRSVVNFLGLGFQVIEWDGFNLRPIFDKMGRIVAVLAGQPRNPTYQAAVERASQAIRDAGSAAWFPASMRRHRHGLFAAITVGLSYGKGQTSPCWISAKEHTAIAEDLLANEDVGRMAGFADAVFALWAPRLYQRYRRCDAELLPNRPQRCPHCYMEECIGCACMCPNSNEWFEHPDGHFFPTCAWCGHECPGCRCMCPKSEVWTEHGGHLGKKHPLYKSR
ncbi:hypothetical protein DFH08DRAFT_725406, partial [Mycena albidolilacea]